MSRVAIQPDRLPGREPGEWESSSEKWADFLRASGHEVIPVDVFDPEIIKQVHGCDGFMWRSAHTPQDRAVARRLLPVFGCAMGLKLYPDLSTYWHYDDKVAQAYLLEAAGIPCPRTWVFWEQESARKFLATARFPLVFKLATGAGSTNVALLTSRAAAEESCRKLFGPGVYSLTKGHHHAPRSDLRWRLRGAARMLIGGDPGNPGEWWELHKNYLLAQEFLPDNPFDTRVTVIGNRAFGFRRFNRPGDFRASGSGQIDHNPSGVATEFIRLAFQTARKLQMQSVAIDGLRRGKEPVVGEVSYTYASWAVHACPGHWVLDGSPDDGRLKWVEGQMWPEEAQVQDFMRRLAEKMSCEPGEGSFT